MIPLTLALLACAEPPERSGTAVGNPGTIGGLAAESPEGISLTSARLTPVALLVKACGGAEASFPLDPVDLLDADNVLGELPAGSWCGIAVELESLVLEGETDGGTRFSVAMRPEAFAIETALTVDGDHLLIEVPVVLEAAALEALGEDVALDPEDPLAEAWTDETSAGAWFWYDEDRDGLISDGDRGLDEYSISAAEADSESGCSARSSRRRLGWPAWLALLALLTLRGTRQGPGRHHT